MKTIKILFTALAITLLSPAISAQKTDTTLIVNGVCSMCEFTIESAATGVEGVKTAEWNVETKVLKLTYHAEQADLTQINDAINASGYDTEYSTAPDEAYNKLHACCHYRDPEVVKDHQK